MLLAVLSCGSFQKLIVQIFTPPFYHVPTEKTMPADCFPDAFRRFFQCLKTGVEASVWQRGIPLHFAYKFYVKKLLNN